MSRTSTATALLDEPLAQTRSPRQDSEKAADNDAIRQFRVNVPEEALVDLRRAPCGDPLAGQGDGRRRVARVQLAQLQELVRYWGTDYDWRRRGEAQRLPSVHDEDRRPRHPLHPRPLTAPERDAADHHARLAGLGLRADQAHRSAHRSDAYGGRAEDAFDVVIPSLPGFGFSDRPTEAGWGPERIGRAWDVLMRRLGYTRYVAQGGDWGAGVVEAMARQAPPGLLGIHTNLPAMVPTTWARRSAAGPCRRDSPSRNGRVRRPAGVRPERGPVLLAMMGARPQAVGYGLTDSPAGLAGWMLVHSGFANWSYGKDPASRRRRMRCWTTSRLYWLTNTAASAAQDLLGEPRPEPDQRERAEDRRDLGPGGDHRVSRRDLFAPRRRGLGAPSPP